MIIDKLENKDLYIGLNENLEKGFKFLLENKIEELEDGRYEIDPDNVFALVQSYTTKNSKEAKWESHEKYVDIQYIHKGEEVIYWTSTKELTISEDLLGEKDVAFYNEDNHCTALNLKGGYFSILFPEDAHKPGCIYNNEASKIKKVVVKVKHIRK